MSRRFGVDKTSETSMRDLSPRSRTLPLSFPFCAAKCARKEVMATWRHTYPRKWTRSRVKFNDLREDMDLEDLFDAGNPDDALNGKKLICSSIVRLTRTCRECDDKPDRPPRGWLHPQCWNSPFDVLWCGADPSHEDLDEASLGFG